MSNYEVPLNQLTQAQKDKLLSYLIYNTRCPYDAAHHIVSGGWGNLTLLEMFVPFCADRKAKWLCTSVMKAE